MTLNISGVERETGLSKDVLRMWERRYGFPKPGRDDNGERQYTVGDVGKLRAVKRLMDVGLRPGKIMTLSLDELNAMADARTPPRRDALAPALERDVLTMLKSHDATSLQHTLANLLMRQGLQKFVLETSRRSTGRSATPGCAASCRSSRSICTPNSCRSRCARRSTRFRARPAIRACC